MLHWKNKPIDQLTKEELQQALSDSVGTLLSKQASNSSNEFFSTFMIGLASGAIIAIAGVFMTSMV